MKNPMIAIEAEGLHPSTVACLEALLSMQDSHDFARILDMGCGGGVLALASAHIWDAKVIAADISEEAVNSASAAVFEHELEDQVTVVRSDGFSHPSIASNGPYDLILANMLAEQIGCMALDIKNNLKPEGYIVVSGVLSWLKSGLEEAFQALHIEFVSKIEITPWCAMIFRHRSVI